MILWLLPWVCLGGLPLLDLEPATTTPLPPAPVVTTIMVQPSTVPRPALRYHLIPERYGLVPGNAALFYHRAVLLLAQKSQAHPAGTARPELSADEQAYQWTSKPIADLPKEEVRQWLSRHANVIHEVELGVRRAHCDWGLSDRPEGIDLLLPEIQPTRTLARLLVLQAKLAILDGQPDRAFRSIQTGLVLARHVGDGPTLIQGIIGGAIGFEMTRCLEQLIGSPGAPSLFWALADRPQPFIDFRTAFEAERHIIEKELPGLTDLDHGVWSVDQARRFADTLQERLFRLIGNETLPGMTFPVPTGMTPTARRLAVAALCARIDPAARRALIAGGRPEAEVNAMPVIQAAVLYTYGLAQDRTDAIFKWANVRNSALASQGHPESLTFEAKESNPLLAIFSTLEAGLESARVVGFRVDRQLDALQVVEAIRLDATRNGGRLPATLDAIRDLPIPLDPATGKAFEYRVVGTSAALTAPGSAETPLLPIEIHLIPPQR